jgi:hypothetical protein
MHGGANSGVGLCLYNNLLPVTLGNILGGCFFCGAAIYFLYLYEDDVMASHRAAGAAVDEVMNKRAEVADRKISMQLSRSDAKAVTSMHRLDDDAETARSRHSSFDGPVEYGAGSPSIGPVMAAFRVESNSMSARMPRSLSMRSDTAPYAAAAPVLAQLSLAAPLPAPVPPPSPSVGPVAAEVLAEEAVSAAVQRAGAADL